MVFVICIYQADFEFKFGILVIEHFLNIPECIPYTLHTVRGQEH